MTTTITKQYQMNYFDPGVNSNKVWIGLAHSDGTFETRFGRVRDGAKLASSRKKLGSAFAAESMLEKLRNEKLRKGYRDSQILDGETEVVVKDVKKDLSRIAAEQIAGAKEDQVTADLITYLAEVNIHNITHATSIRYNAANATFTTPLGVLTPGAIAEARDVLARIQNFRQGSPFRAHNRNNLVRDYFQLVPKDFGMKVPRSEELLSDAKSIQAESAILDALDAALSSMKPQADADSKLFECRLSKVPHWTDEGKTLFRKTRTLFESTRNASHQTAGLKLTRLYEVEISGMKTQFEEASKKFGNVRQDLWHGTKASNLLAILKSGLIIPPASASHCTGRMFGNGIYTSLQSTKALNYATDFWNKSGKQRQRTFMFLCEVALGKTHKPNSYGGHFPARGTDSTWVEAGTAGVMNHECVVYDTAQINLCYLAEFGAV